MKMDCQIITLVVGLCLGSGTSAVGQSRSSQPRETPQTRMRPIGAPSAVDKYRSPRDERQSGYSRPAAASAARRAPSSVPAQLASVRQVTRMQAEPGVSAPPLQNGYGMPPAGSSGPSGSALPGNGAGAGGFSPPPLPPSDRPRALPADSLPQFGSGTYDDATAVTSTPPSVQSGPLRSAEPAAPLASPNSDYMAVPQPRMHNDNFATIDNCNCISGPSTYTAASAWGCGSPIAYATPAAYNPPPAEIPAPAVMPAPALAPAPAVPPVAGVPPTAAPVGSLFTLGQEAYPIEIGQGLWGQPKAYVVGQKCRNWLRYFTF